MTYACRLRSVSETAWYATGLLVGEHWSISTLRIPRPYFPASAGLVLFVRGLFLEVYEKPGDSVENPFDIP